MSRMYHCPYFASAKKLTVRCELAELGFPDQTAKERFVVSFCAAHPGWEKCQLARVMNEYYERKDRSDAKRR